MALESKHKDIDADVEHGVFFISYAISLSKIKNFTQTTKKTATTYNEVAILGQLFLKYKQLTVVRCNKFYIRFKTMV
ncbi:MAG: hypothetical protein LBJ67_17085 [Planctomycetaceae bacterium]|jgi:hypothetical protein|nr:hypothetical protein [Planctomycetaceae bacterium]